ncbi:MAG: hypothetical protein KatS3mg052_0995 [Candidatus Roseilinea sp.]|nr:MAG: hypothetical protein KatS3mg052_0995 [Candidatus Roseilinea sp.]
MFTDSRSRVKALYYDCSQSTGKDAIIQAVFNGYAVKLGANMSPVMARFYQDGLQGAYPYDLPAIRLAALWAIARTVTCHNG